METTRKLNNMADVRENGLKILMASDLYYPYPGGISEHVHHLTLELRNRGHNVEILTTKYRIKSFDFEDPPFVTRIGRGIKIPMNKSFTSITFTPRITKWVKEILESGDYDIVHTHGALAPMLPMLVLLYSQSLNFATFHAAHDYSRAYELFKPILQKVFEKIDGPIAVSEVARDSMAQHFPGEYRIIPNGVDINRFRPGGPYIERFRGDEWKNILFVGRFDPRKGLRYLIKAMYSIVEEFPKTRLLIIGGGPLQNYYKSFIREKISRNVFFLGIVPPEDLPKFYRTADVFVSPATGGESFGIVLLEAMASGTPIVASNIPGYRQVLEHGKEGFLAEPCNPEDLAEKIKTILKNPELAKRMGISGRIKAVNTYSWPKIAEQVEAYYFEIMERKGWKKPSSLTVTM